MSDQTPAQRSAAPPNDLTHPAVLTRLSKDMRATAAVLDSADPSSFATDEPWAALTLLRSSVQRLLDEAGQHRPTLS